MGMIMTISLFVVISDLTFLAEWVIISIVWEVYS